MTNLAVLERAEAEYDRLVRAFEADKAAAEVVSLKIAAIGTVTLESKAAIRAARTAYEALTETQRELVENIDVLIEAEEAYRKLEAGSHVERPNENMLKSAIRAAEMIDLSEFTKESADAVRKAIEAARVVLNDPRAGKDEIKAALKAIIS